MVLVMSLQFQCVMLCVWCVTFGYHTGSVQVCTVQVVLHAGVCIVQVCILCMCVYCAGVCTV